MVDFSQSLPLLIEQLVGAYAPPDTGQARMANTLATMLRAQAQQKYYQDLKTNPNAKVPFGLTSTEISAVQKQVEQDQTDEYLRNIAKQRLDIQQQEMVNQGKYQQNMQETAKQRLTGEQQFQQQSLSLREKEDLATEAYRKQVEADQHTMALLTQQRLLETQKANAASAADRAKLDLAMKELQKQIVEAQQERAKWEHMRYMKAAEVDAARIDALKGEEQKTALQNAKRSLDAAMQLIIKNGNPNPQDMNKLLATYNALAPKISPEDRIYFQTALKQVAAKLPAKVSKTYTKSIDGSNLSTGEIPLPKVSAKQAQGQAQGKTTGQQATGASPTPVDNSDQPFKGYLKAIPLGYDLAKGAYNLADWATNQVFGPPRQLLYYMGQNDPLTKRITGGIDAYKKQLEGDYTMTPTELINSESSVPPVFKYLGGIPDTIYNNLSDISNRSAELMLGNLYHAKKATVPPTATATPMPTPTPTPVRSTPTPRYVPAPTYNTIPNPYRKKLRNTRIR